MEEAWLRGPIPGVSPLLAPVLASFQQAREDLARHTEGLTTAQLWAIPAAGGGSVGFNLRHIAGSVDRLTTYLQGGELTAAQMAALQTEKDPGASREELLESVDRAFRHAEAVVRAIDPTTLSDPRTVGRKRLPTTVIGLLTHIAEHTQRHVGESIVTARGTRSRSSSS
jgi:uncharacterized damage-inducible protein DinB